MLKYEEIVAMLEAMAQEPVSYDLSFAEKFSNVKKAFNLLGLEFSTVPFVHITGTKGKGSTTTMLNSVLIEAGYKVGKFISPHNFHHTERMEINGVEISREEFTEIMNEIIEMRKKHNLWLSFFAMLTLCGIKYFSRRKLDIIVMEVGLGGLLDPTNIIPSDIQIITNIDLEHTEELGNTIKEIAYQKAGIIKENSICITTENNPVPISVFTEVAKGKNAKILVIEDSDIDSVSSSFKGEVFNFGHYKNVEIGLKGRHQQVNCASVISCVEVLNSRGFSIDEFSMRNGLKKASLPLRLEVISEDPIVIVDGAHTPMSVDLALSSIKKVLPNKRFIVVCGFAKKKKYEEMLEVIFSKHKDSVRFVYLTEAKFKGVEKEELKRILEKRCFEIDFELANTVNEARIKAIELARKENCVVFCLGSIYLSAEFARLFKS